MCAPGSEPFSRTTTETSCERSAASCLRRIAVASPAGPAPTIATSQFYADHVLPQAVALEASIVSAKGGEGVLALSEDQF